MRNIRAGEKNGNFRFLSLEPAEPRLLTRITTGDRRQRFWIFQNLFNPILFFLFFNCRGFKTRLRLMGRRRRRSPRWKEIKLKLNIFEFSVHVFIPYLGRQVLA